MIAGNRCEEMLMMVLLRSGILGLDLKPVSSSWSWSGNFVCPCLCMLYRVSVGVSVSICVYLSQHICLSVCVGDTVDKGCVDVASFHT